MKILALLTLIVAAYVLYAAVRIMLAREVGHEAVSQAVPYQRSQGEVRVLVVGDSTAVGVGATQPEKSIAGLLANEFSNVSLENRALSGAKLHDIATQLAGADKTYDLVLIHAGANDVLYFSSERTIQDGIARVFEEAQKKSKKIVVLTAGNIGLAPVLPWPLGFIMTARTKSVRTLMQAEAAKSNAYYVDLYKDRGSDPFENNVSHFYAPDGLHLSDYGYAYWYAEIRRQAGAAFVGLND